MNLQINYVICVFKSCTRSRGPFFMEFITRVLMFMHLTNLLKKYLNKESKISICFVTQRMKRKLTILSIFF